MTGAGLRSRMLYYHKLFVLVVWKIQTLPSFTSVTSGHKLYSVSLITLLSHFGCLYKGIVLSGWSSHTSDITQNASACTYMWFAYIKAQAESIVLNCNALSTLFSSGCHGKPWHYQRGEGFVSTKSLHLIYTDTKLVLLLFKLWVLLMPVDVCCKCISKKNENKLKLKLV